MNDDGHNTRRQLSSLDVQFLNAETGTTPTHVGVVAVLDPSTAPGRRVRVEEVRAVLASRLHLVPALRWRLHRVPAGLDLPYWVDTARVDLERHVQEIHLPRPGTDAELGDVVGRLAELPLERDAPLWQAYLISGLNGGQQALYAKVHHAVVDGVSGAEVLAVLFDISATPDFAPAPTTPLVPTPPPVAERGPGAGEMARRGGSRLLHAPMRLARNAPGLLATPGLVAGLSRTLPWPPRLAPRTPLNDRLTARRAFAFTSLPMDEISPAREALGLTLNDTVLALCSSALRDWLYERDELPDRPLVAAVPVSVRTAEQLGTAGNQISLMLTALPTDIADPAGRLAALRRSVGTAKRNFARRPARLLHYGSAAIPQVLHGAATRALVRTTRLAPPLFNLFVSNVPGPQLPLYAAGARVLGTYPVSVVAQIGGGVNITVMSYDGHLDFGVISCPDVAPDGWRLIERLRPALADLTALAGSHRTSRRRLHAVTPTG